MPVAITKNQLCQVYNQCVSLAWRSDFPLQFRAPPPSSEAGFQPTFTYWRRLPPSLRMRRKALGLDVFNDPEIQQEDIYGNQLRKGFISSASPRVNATHTRQAALRQPPAYRQRCQSREAFDVRPTLAIPSRLVPWDATPTAHECNSSHNWAGTSWRSSRSHRTGEGFVRSNNWR